MADFKGPGEWRRKAAKARKDAAPPKPVAENVVFSVDPALVRNMTVKELRAEAESIIERFKSQS